jgi:glutamine synthetase
MTSAADTIVRIHEDIKRLGIETVRLAFVDQHGILRGKTVAVAALEAVLEKGLGMPSSLLAKDTSNKTVFPVFAAPGAGLGIPEFEGAADVLMVADPSTWRVLPWASKTGWLLCDLRFPNGKPVPFDTRGLLKQALGELAAQGFGYVAGLEIEFHIFRTTNPHLQPEDAGQPGSPPEVALLSTGYQLLSESRYDQIEPALEILRANLVGLNLPLRSFECEFGPSQAEVTLDTLEGLAAADAMVLFRSATKQILRRHGYHATFMCRPKLPNVMSSGWHLHQSLSRLATKENAFVSKNDFLSETGKHFLAGLLAHAKATCALATPTINGYKRFRPYSLAPDHIHWGRDNRGAMLRVIGAPGDAATRIENRIGEPAANPYLYLASQIYAGLDGIAKKMDSGPPDATPYESKAEHLPATLAEALSSLKQDQVLRDGLGSAFVDYYCKIKEAEIARYNLEVSDWEHREYFDLF